MTRTSDQSRSVRLRIGGIQLAELGRSEASALFIVVLALAAVTILGLRGGADAVAELVVAIRGDGRPDARHP